MYMNNLFNTFMQIYTYIYCSVFGIFIITNNKLQYCEYKYLFDIISSELININDILKR